MTDWLDAHTHLDSDELYPQKDEVLKRAADAGVRQMILVNSEATEESFKRTLECARFAEAPKCFCAMGIHPHHANLYSSSLEQTLLSYLKQPEIIAFGEIGLDFFYDFSPRNKQAEALKRQLDLSLELNLPVMIHCRDAYGELADILQSIRTRWRGVIHCFTGTAEEAERLLGLGFYISFSGIITFKKAKLVRKSAKAVPLNRILVETDAPYLSPEPMRGKTNEPSFVVHTAKFLAELRETDPQKFSAQLFSNFSACFSL